MREALQRQWQGGVEGDQLYLRNFANTMLRLWENIYYQYQSGPFGEAEFQAEMGLRYLKAYSPMATPGRVRIPVRA